MTTIIFQAYAIEETNDYAADGTDAGYAGADFVDLGSGDDNVRVGGD